MGIFSKFKSGFKNGSSMLQGAFDRLVGRQVLQNEDIVALEEAFYSCDFGPETTDQILEEIQSSFKNKDGTKDGTPMECARRVLSSSLTGAEGKLDTVSSENPQTICLIGVNGSGKTTTCAKLGNLLKVKGHKVLLGACDTFRAAAIEQLTLWSKKLDIPIISSKQGHDPSAVAYDTIDSAKSKNFDHVIIDTAGRLHTQTNLANELKKIHRICDKAHEGSPHRTILVLDGTQGNSAIAQAKSFNDMIGIDGIIITKLDGTAKGGSVFSIAYALELPILYVGTGEQAENLVPFDKYEFVDGLLDALYSEES